MLSRYEQLEQARRDDFLRRREEAAARGQVLTLEGAPAEFWEDQRRRERRAAAEASRRSSLPSAQHRRLDVP